MGDTKMKTLIKRPAQVKLSSLDWKAVASFCEKNDLVVAGTRVFEGEPAVLLSDLEYYAVKAIRESEGF